MLDSLQTRVIEFIRLHELFAGAERVLLAVSGGADSVALLHIVATLQGCGLLSAKLVCAHVNHQLRDAESDGDERFVVEQAAGLGLSMVTTKVDVRRYAQDHRLSLETAARQVRLASLARMAKEHGCGWVATGHQKNDNAETVVHRLRRGTGFRGLAGIRPVRPFGDGLRLARPLLCLTRAEILTYLGEHGLPWREDRTNADTAHTRNYIRHRLLPTLQQEAEHSTIKELCDLAACAGRLHDRIRREADAAWGKLATPSQGEVSLCLLGLAALFEPVAIELIRLALAHLGSGERDLTAHHFKGILELAHHVSAGRSLSLPGGLVAQRRKDALVLTKPSRVGLAPPPPELATDQPLRDRPAILNTPGVTKFAGWDVHARILPHGETEVRKTGRDKGRFIEYLDWDRVRPPLVVRHRRDGDRFQPLGMANEKKVGKFLTAAKVPDGLREQILIFADRERIVWVCPVRISERAKVTENTRQILELKVSYL